MWRGGDSGLLGKEETGGRRAAGETVDGAGGGCREKQPGRRSRPLPPPPDSITAPRPTLDSCLCNILWCVLPYSAF